MHHQERPGNSDLKVPKAAAQAHEAFEVEIDLTKIFENPTITAIAELVEAAKMEQDILMSDGEDEDDDEELVI